MKLGLFQAVMARTLLRNESTNQLGNRVVPWESIEWFIEGQAFSPSYDLAPPPPSSPFPLSVCHRLSLLAGDGWGRGLGRSQSKWWRESLVLYKSLIISGWYCLTYYSKVGSRSDTQRRCNRLFFFWLFPLCKQTWRSRPLIFSPLCPGVDFKHSLYLDPHKCQKNLRGGKLFMTFMYSPRTLLYPSALYSAELGKGRGWSISFNNPNK